MASFQAENTPVGGEAPPARADEFLDKLLPLTRLRESPARELMDVLESLPGSKCLILQKELRGIVDKMLVGGMTSLKQSGVNYFHELNELATLPTFDGGPPPEKVVFLCRPSLRLMKSLAQLIHNLDMNGSTSDYHLYFVPQSSVACEQALEDAGILDQIEIGEIQLGFAPVDSDLLTLNMGDVFRECYVDGDASSLNVVASALHKLQLQFGTIPQVKSKGAASRKVLQKMLHLRRKETLLESHENGHKPYSAYASNVMGGSGRPEIDTLVVLDREMDLVSPLLSPLTYEGLIDDLLGVENCATRVSEELFGVNEGPPGGSKDLPDGGAEASSSTPKKEVDLFSEFVKHKGTVKVLLDNSDVIFSEIRNLSVQRLGTFLQERAVEIKQRYAAFRENKDASISEIHDFVKRMPALTKEYKSLNQHIHIAELLKTTTDSRDFREQGQGERGMLEGESCLDAIDEIILADAEGAELYRVLRMMCLQSITAGGIRSNRFDSLRRAVVQTYGYQHLYTISNLERAGLLKRKDLILVDTTQPVWQGLRKQLKLIDDSEDDGSGEARNMSYVSAGYAPLSARLIQNLVTLRPAGMSQPSWQSVAEVARLMPGPTLELTQGPVPDELSEALQRHTDKQQQQQSGEVNAAATKTVEQELLQLSLAEGEEGRKKVMLVCIVGGLSFIEVAAFRFLSNDPSFPFHLVLASTNICNGDSFLKSISMSF